MMELVTDCFALQMCHTGFIDDISHTDFFSELGDSVGCCYQPHVRFDLLVGR